MNLELLEDMKVTAVLIPDTNVVQNVFINEVMANNVGGHADAREPE